MTDFNALYHDHLDTASADKRGTEVFLHLSDRFPIVRAYLNTYLDEISGLINIFTPTIPNGVRDRTTIHEAMVFDPAALPDQTTETKIVDINGTLTSVTTERGTQDGEIFLSAMDIGARDRASIHEAMVFDPADLPGDNDYGPNLDDGEVFITLFSASVNEPPFYDLVSPVSGATEVATDANIEFRIQDDIPGVDSGSIIVKIKTQGGSFVTAFESGSFLNPYSGAASVVTGSGSNGFHFTIDPEFDFASGSLIEVEVTGSDAATPPLTAVTGFCFTVTSSATGNAPPFWFNNFPACGATDVPSGTLISFTLDDIDPGVSLEDTIIQIGVFPSAMLPAYIGTNAPGTEFIFPFNGTGSSVTQVSGGTYDFVFQLDQTVSGISYQPGLTLTVSASVKDAASPQLTSELSCTFTITGTGVSNEPPFYLNKAPASGATGIDPSDNILLTIDDITPGVDLDSVIILVKTGSSAPFEVAFSGSDFVSPYSGTNSSVSIGSLTSYNFVIDPESDLPAGNLIEISSTAADGLGLSSTDLYCFTTDNEPPFVDDAFPCGLSNQATDVVIDFKIKDFNPGVDLDSVNIKIKRYVDAPVELVYASGTFFNGYTGSITSSIAQVPQDADGFQFFITASSPYPNNATVQLQVSASDLSDNPLTGTFSCEFNTALANENTPPFWECKVPAEGATEVDVTSSITIGVDDLGPGVDFNTIVIKIDPGVGVFQTAFQTGTFSPEYSGAASTSSFSGTAGYEFIIDRINPYPFSSTIVISASAFDLAVPALEGAITCSFETTGTTGTNVPPTIICKDPLDGATNVATGSLIVLGFEDETAVDLSTIVIDIKRGSGTFVTAFSGGTFTEEYDEINSAAPASGTGGFEVTIDPENDFPASTVIFISATAADNQGLTSSVLCSFTTTATSDPNAPPFLTDLNPFDCQVGVPTGSTINLTIDDISPGVDISTVVIEVKRGDNPSEIAFSGSSFVGLYDNTGSISGSSGSAGYGFVLNRSEDFAGGVLIQVTASAADYLGLGFTGSYKFTTIAQIPNEPPFFANYNPTCSATGVAAGTNISFRIDDIAPGVDLNSVIITINTGSSFETAFSGGVFLSPYSGAASTVVTGGIGGYDFTIDPESVLPFSQTIIISSTAADLFSASATDSCSFQIVEANAPPFFSMHSPSCSVSGVATDTNISFLIEDIGPGVDSGTLVVNINSGSGFQTAFSGGSFLSPYNGPSSSIIVSGIMGYYITIDPVNDFPFSQLITISSTVADLAVPAMSSSDLCVFTTTGNFGPFFTDHAPSCSVSGVAIDTNISFLVDDLDPGVDSGTLVIQINTGSMFETAFSGGSFLAPYNGASSSIVSSGTAGYYITIDPVDNLPFSQLITISSSVSDLAMVPLTGTDLCTFTTTGNAPPFFTDHSPSCSATGVNIDTNISFLVDDLSPGVDSGSLVVRINTGSSFEVAFSGGSFLSPYNGAGSQIVPSGSNGFYITFDPTSNFPFLQLISISSTVGDSAVTSLTASDLCTFTTTGNVPPFYTNLDPSNGATDVVVNTNIKFLVDDFSPGVDLSTVIVRIKVGTGSFVTAFSNSAFLAPYNGAGSTFVAGGSNGYNFTIDPVSDFPTSTVIQVSSSAADTALIPLTGTVLWSFTTGVPEEVCLAERSKFYDDDYTIQTIGTAVYQYGENQANTCSFQAPFQMPFRIRLKGTAYSVTLKRRDTVPSGTHFPLGRE